MNGDYKMLAQPIFKSLALLILQERLDNFSSLADEDGVDPTLAEFRTWGTDEEIVMLYVKGWADEIAAELTDLVAKLPAHTFGPQDDIPLSRLFAIPDPDIAPEIGGEYLTLSEVNRVLADRRSKKPKPSTEETESDCCSI